MKNTKAFIILILILIVGAFLRFYNLDWGQGLFTHPDEYHITASVNQLSYPNQMNPHFFSYGTVTIYLIYFTQEILRYVSSVLSSEFIAHSAFLIGRFYSALFSTLTIFVVYGISRIFLKTKYSLLAALLAALTPGLIQQAHFATPESALIFFLFGSLFFLLKFTKNQKILYSILASIFLGFALAVKISSVVFLVPLIITLVYVYLKNRLRLITTILVSGIVTIATFALSAPFVFLDYASFRSNLDYEAALAIGNIPVFYTRQFIDTIPVIFQIEKIFPYALGPVTLILGILGILYIAARNVKKPNFQETILIIAFLSLFLPNAFLFAKWTRFIAPVFPFFAIFAVFFLQDIKRFRNLFYFLLAVLILTTSIWTMAFYSIYISPDVRITASEWLEANAKPGSIFLVEGGNMVDLPLSGNYTKISLDFYNLEENPLLRQRVIDSLYTSDYFLVQSRRVFMNHQRLLYLYPKTARFYDALFDEQLGFEQIKEFQSYPQLQIKNYNLQIPDEGAEETWSVFDHPVIRVFKKNAQLTREGYEKVFEN